MGGELFSIFHKKSASKPPKWCDFAYFTSQWGARAPPPGYATARSYSIHSSKSVPNEHFLRPNRIGFCQNYKTKSNQESIFCDVNFFNTNE